MEIRGNRIFPGKPEIEEIVRFYNDTCKSLRPVKTLTDKRREAVYARLREHGREAVFDVIRARRPVVVSRRTEYSRMDGRLRLDFQTGKFRESAGRQV